MINEKNKIITFFIIVLLILSINNQNDLKQSYPTENIDGSFLGKVQDEFHTLLLGTREMFGESNDVNRVGSFSRTVVKSLSPIGVLYMTKLSWLCRLLLPGKKLFKLWRYFIWSKYSKL